MNNTKCTYHYVFYILHVFKFAQINTKIEESCKTVDCRKCTMICSRVWVNDTIQRTAFQKRLISERLCFRALKKGRFSASGLHISLTTLSIPCKKEQKRQVGLRLMRKAYFDFSIFPIYSAIA